MLRPSQLGSFGPTGDNGGVAYFEGVYGSGVPALIRRILLQAFVGHRCWTFPASLMPRPLSIVPANRIIVGCGDRLYCDLEKHIVP